ncbi:MAG TPA: hypothetical protein DCL35_02050 [Candidatus Omnitrophica bacterium]|nr:hypothetical protein [Candidatus Omnitrophota bacterium]
MPFVFIVIVNWNGKVDLLECLASLKSSDYPKDRYSIVVVDNGSSDGSQAAIAREHPDATLLKNTKNIGYVMAANQGIVYALDSGADYVWVLNNDVSVNKDTLSRLVAIGEKDGKVGVIAPVIYSFQEPPRIENAGYKINFWTGQLKKLKIGRDIFADPADRSADVDSILGCADLIRALVFKKIGYLREAYELYFEETDFNVRARKAGYRVVVVKDACVKHRNASTMNRLIFRRAYLLLRNLFIFEVLNAERRHLFVFIPYYFFIHIPWFLLRGCVYGIQVKLKCRFK